MDYTHNERIIVESGKYLAQILIDYDIQKEMVIMMSKIVFTRIIVSMRQLTKPIKILKWGGFGSFILLCKAICLNCRNIKRG